jgi:hypothetical protein
MGKKERIVWLGILICVATISVLNYFWADLAKAFLATIAVMAFYIFVSVIFLFLTREKEEANEEELEEESEGSGEESREELIREREELTTRLKNLDEILQPDKNLSLNELASGLEKARIRAEIATKRFLISRKIKDVEKQKEIEDLKREVFETEDETIRNEKLTELEELSREEVERIRAQLS